MFRNNKTFFEHFDYNWVLERENICDLYELQYQYFILDILCDISISHPTYINLGNIIFKKIQSKSFFAESRRFNEYKWIIISQPVLNLLQLYNWLMIEIYEKANLTYGIEEKYCKDSIDILLEKEPIFIKQRILSFLGVIMSYSESYPSEFNRELHKKLITNVENNFYYNLSGVYFSTEMYIICHELAHLIENSDLDPRSLDLELKTDISASSLFIIHSSKFQTGENYHCIGPIIFYELSILFMLCRHIIYSTDVNKVKFIDPNDLYELEIRYIIFQNNLTRNFAEFPFLLNKFEEAYSTIHYQFVKIKEVIVNSIK